MAASRIQLMTSHTELYTRLCSAPTTAAIQSGLACIHVHGPKQVSNGSGDGLQTTFQSRPTVALLQSGLAEDKHVDIGVHARGDADV